MGFPVRPVDRALYERDVEAAWQGVGEQRFTAAWNGGRTMSLEEAVAVALTENVSTDLAP
jgi:hypothetical protein